MINLLKGDCIKLMQDIPDGSIDMILCDLPYYYKGQKLEYMVPLDAIWKHYERIIKSNGAVVLHAPMDASLDKQFLNKATMNVRQIINWNDGTYYRKCYVFCLETPVHNKAVLTSFNEEMSVELKKFAKYDKKHPFYLYQSPVSVMEYLIRTYTNEGDTVLDNCMGTGSTGVACVNSGRNFIGMDIDDTHYHIAQLRILQ